MDNFDVPGAYLHAEMPKEKRILMNLRGDFDDIMCQVNPEYKQNVGYENRKKFLYLLVLRAIYGCIQSAFLWYKLFLATLERICFEINPYYICVENKTIEGTQCNIYWYVDEKKLSHKNPSVISDIINKVKIFLEIHICER